MESKRNCAIVQDLLPAYVDKMTKPETTAFVDAHLTDCESCRKVCRAMSGTLPKEAVQAEQMVRRLQTHHRRKLLRRWAIAAALLLIAAVCLLPLPRQIDVSHEGILWRCGTPEEEQAVTVYVEGMYYDFLFLQDQFKVRIMSEQQIPQIYDDLYFTPMGNGQYGIWYQTSDGRVKSFGSVYLRPDGSGLMLCLYDKEGSWNSKDGQMLTAPASSREEAVSLANELADELSPDWLGKWEFE